MIAEVDARAGFGDVLHLVEQRLERIGRHQVGNERRHAAHRGCRGLCRGILGYARPRDVLAVPEMQMHVDHAGQHGLARTSSVSRASTAVPGERIAAIRPWLTAISTATPSVSGSTTASATNNQVEAHRRVLCLLRGVRNCDGLKSAQRARLARPV